MNKRGVAQYLFIGALLIASAIFLVSSIEFRNDSFSSDFSKGDFFAITGRTTTVGGGGNQSRLIVFDQGDAEGGSRTTNLVAQAYFFANYTNTTSNVNITNANCTINFTGLGAAMSYNATSTLYQFNRTINTTGTNLYNVSCLATGFEQLNATGENITVSQYVNSNRCDDFAQLIYTPNVIFNLTNNIDVDDDTSAFVASNFVCMWVQAANITVECNRFTVVDVDTGGNSGQYYGVYSTVAGTRVNNCRFLKMYVGPRFAGATSGSITNVTVINGTNYGIFIESSSANINITNVSIIGSSNVDGALSIKDSSNITVRDSYIKDTTNQYSGIFVSNSNGIQILGTTVENATYVGLEINPAHGTIVRDSIFKNNTNNGILIASSENVSIINVTSIGNKVDGIDESSGKRLLVFSSNISYNRAFGIDTRGDFTNVTNNLIAHNDGDGIKFTGVSGAIATNNTLVGNGNISDVSGSASAIWLDQSDNNNIIRDNRISDSPYGIVMPAGGSASDSIFNGNVINNASVAGIFIGTGARNNLTNNTISNSTVGIFIQSTNSIIDGNILLNDSISINSTASAMLNVVRDNGTVRINFTGIIRNIINNLFIDTSIISLNSSAEPNLNKSANITLDFTDQCPATLYFFDAFTTDASAAISGGQVCSDSTTPACKNITCSAPTVTFNAARFSTYAVQGTTPPPTPSSGSGRSSGPRCSPVTTTCGAWGPCTNDEQSRVCRTSIGNCYSYNNVETQSCAVPITQPPVVQQPGQQGIQPQNVVINPYACVLVNNTEVSKETVSASPAPLPEIKEGFEAILPPFNVACALPALEMTLTIPDNYGDVEALRCKGSRCRKISLTKTEQLSCGAPVFEDLSRTNEFLTPEFFPIPVVRSESSTGQIETSGNKVSFSGLKGSVSLEAPTDPVREAENTGIRIIGTPIVLTFSESNTDLATELTLPYILPEKVDEFSIAIYALKEGSWRYLGGNVNASADTVTAIIPDLTNYLDNNKVTLAVMGLPCLTCFGTEFKKVYEGRSREAVILVHGFENTPKRFEDIINDIRLTDQPWQAWTFGYPSHQTINESAKEFADMVQAQSNEFDYLYIASHSMGGLITQQMLRYAYEENKRVPGSYSFINKIRKVIIIAAPNKGTLSKGIYEDLYGLLLNSKVVQGLFNLNSRVLNELISGRIVDRVPGIEYFVIAGTEPYPFSRTFGFTNDGIVSLDSAQTIGNEQVTNKCENYWELKVTHTDLLNNYDSRRVVERIVAREVAEAVGGKSIMGFNQYYELNVDDCSPSDTFVVIGKNVPESAAASPGLCGCGNNVCGLDENEVSCPSDCANIRKPFPFNLLWMLLGLIAIIFFLIILLTRKKKEEKPEVMTKGMAVEGKLNYLLTQTRIHLRLNDLEQAAMFYSKFNTEYSLAPFDVRERFKDSALDVRKEIRRKLTS